MVVKIMRRVLYILGQLNDQDADWLAANGKKMKLTAGGTLIDAGQPIEYLYILLEGSLLVTDAASGQELSRLGIGDVVGEISFVDTRPPTATVTTRSDSLLLQLDKDHLTAKLEQDVAFAARFYRAIAIFLADKLRGMVEQMGYGETERLDEGLVYQDEMDDNTLGTVSLAGERFDRLLKRLLQE